MSWDIFVQDLPADAKTIDDIPSDFRPAPIGQRSEVIQQIKEVVPFADFADSSWGIIESDGWSIEVNIGDEPVCSSFAFHVRGYNDEVIGVIAAILERMKLRALDASCGDFFSAGPESLEAFRKWREYRDHVLRSE